MAMGRRCVVEVEIESERSPLGYNNFAVSDSNFRLEIDHIYGL